MTTGPGNDRAKIQLSATEMKLAGDAGLILTKNSIIARAVEMMAGLADVYRAAWNADLGAGMGEPKISRGENYNGLPWVMLDYPRLFGKEDVFAIRTMFWWGNGFQLILHLKGQYLERFMPCIRRGLPVLAAAGFHEGISEEEWRHELAPDVYRPLVAGRGLRENNPFLKLAAPLPVDRWNEAPETLLELFVLLVTTLEL